MSDWHHERPELEYYIGQAQAERAATMARLGYLAVAVVGRIVAGAIATAQSARDALVAWRDRRAALRELLLLDDRMLKDIGLTRAEAWAAVEGTLGERALESAEPVFADYFDIALSGDSVVGCNDNGERRRVA